MRLRGFDFTRDKNGVANIKRYGRLNTNMEIEVQECELIRNKIES